MAGGSAGAVLGWAGSWNARLAFTRHREPEIRPARCGGATGQSAGNPLASGALIHTGACGPPMRLSGDLEPEPVEGHLGARRADQRVEEPAEVVGVTVQLMPAPLLGGPQADVPQVGPRELQLVVTSLGDDILVVPIHHVRNGHPQDPGPPRTE